MLGHFFTKKYHNNKTPTFCIREDGKIGVCLDSRHEQISTVVIQEKVKSLSNTIRSANKAFEFNANRGWYGKFKLRFGLRNLKLTDEAPSADYEESKKFPDMPKSIIDEGGYSPRQVFNIDERGLYWKRLSSRTFISKKEATTPRFKAFKDSLTLVLGRNVASN